jgi:hypothetical protein
MKRLFGCILLVSSLLSAQPENIQATLLELKDAGASKSALSNRLANQMMARAKHNQTPSRPTVQRFSSDLVSALAGKDITTIRAAVLEKAIADVLRGNGSTFLPASNLRDALAGCGVDEPTAQSIVKRFIEIGQQVRGPDDMKVMPVDRLK